MAPKKHFYLVLKGHTPGIYSTWAECQAQTHKFNGAIFKGFTTKEDLYHHLGQAQISPQFITDADFTSKLNAQEYIAYLKQANIGLTASDLSVNPQDLSQIGTTAKSSLKASSSISSTKSGSKSTKTASASKSASKTSTQAINQAIEAQIQDLKEGQGLAFVDGSFDSKNKAYSYGLVLITTNKTLTLNQKLQDPRFIHARNVAGEVAGVQKAIALAYEQGLTSIKVFYDYKGIEYWARGLWKAKQDLTQEYKDFFNSYKNKISISFEHVPAHTGITYNEQADQLAKEALGIN